MEQECEVIVSADEMAPVLEGRVDPCVAVGKAILLLQSAEATESPMEEMRQEAIAECRATLAWLIGTKLKAMEKYAAMKAARQ